MFLHIIKTDQHYQTQFSLVILHFHPCFSQDLEVPEILVVLNFAQIGVKWT